MDEYDFELTETKNREKPKITKFRDHFNDDDQKGRHWKKKQNRKPRRKKDQQADW